jgi:NAD-reducing hydrogenase small subunit
MSLLDMDESIIAVLEKADIVFGPLVDAQEWPEGVAVAVIEGAVSSQDDLKLARTARARSKVVVALGDCAVTGNVPSMRNGIPTRKLLERVYVEGATVHPGVPTDGVPALLKQASPLQEAIDVDVYVPGCPPKPDAILMVLSELVEGHDPELGSKLRFG